MEKLALNKPFFVFNPKSYLYGENMLEMAKIADETAKKNPEVSVLVTVPFADIKNIADNTENIIVTAQHIDGIDPGVGIGHALAESIDYAGAQATFLNHAEKPMTLGNLLKAIEKAKELDIYTIVCADTLEEAKVIATFKPDVILCEPTELIGTGQTSDKNYILKTTEAIKNIDSEILVMQAAGISTAADVYNTIDAGADGTGCTSGVVKAEDPEQMLIDMIEAAAKF